MSTRFSDLGLALGVLDRTLIGKALPSILTEDGFLREVLREAVLLQKGVQGSVDKAMGRVRRSTNINWRGATPAQRQRVVDQLGRLLKGLPSEFLPKVSVVLDERGQLVVTKTKRALNKKHKRLDISPSLRQVDLEGVAALRDTTSLFFGPEYARQADRFEARAQATITSGLERGLGRKEIAKDLQDEFRGAAIHQSYWETAAGIHVNRARSFSSALAYADAEVTEYEVIAVMDERTSPICQFMNGKTLKVQSALNSFNAFENAETLEEVRDRVAPLMHVSKGRIVLPSGRRVATIGAPGKFEGGLTPKQLNNSNVNMPPYHFRCYPGSTTVQGRIVLCSRTLYSGEVVDICTKRGRRITLTPNHPVMTPHGFVRADVLKNGDDLLAHSVVTDLSSVGSIDQFDKQHEPSPVEQVFSSLAKRSGILTIDRVADDFHGDGIFGIGQIEVVAPDRELLLGRVAEFTKHGRDPVFVQDAPASGRSVLLQGSSPRDDLGVSMCATTSGKPCSTALALDRGRAPGLDLLPLESLCIGPASEIDASLYEHSLDGSFGDAMLATDLLRRHPRQIVVDQILHIRRRPFDGHVYDLQAEGGWLAADDIIVSNCRTTVAPVF